MKIAPSMLACDFTKMGDEIKRITEGGADWVHLDVMDGNFVPNISFGPAIIKSLRPLSSLPFDVHLMISNPIKYIDDFVNAGVDIITFHIESESCTDDTIKKIREHGAKIGIAIKPNTPIENVFKYLDDLYMVLVMTVEPGFGGQSFMPEMMQKVDKLKYEISKRNLNVIVEVDGGINSSTIQVASEHRVDVCVAGTAVFKSKNTCDTISSLKSF